jgi:uncharacterized GH25 family protein
MRIRAICWLIAGVVLLCGTLPAAAHEYWLEPAAFAVQAGQSVPIHIYVGEHFKANSFPYLREEYKKFVIAEGRNERPVRAIDGDDPVTVKLNTPGLAIIAAYTVPETLTFESWDKFEAYLRFEGLEHIAPRHREQGKLMSAIVEHYIRCAKLLLNAAGAGGGGEDRVIGLPLELIAERNPYRLAPGEALPVRLLHNGKPIAGVQITALNKADPQKRHHVRTDAEGRARIALPSAGPWLLNAVHMVDSTTANVHWLSWWASMTFARP